MDNKYKKFLTVGLVSIAIGLGASVSQDAQAMTMPAVKVSPVATNVAISSSHNAANIAIANSKNTNKNMDSGDKLVLSALLIAALGSFGFVGWLAMDGSKLDKNIKKRISDVRSKFLSSDKTSENNLNFK